MDVHHIGFSDRKLCIWDVPPATANRRFAGNFFAAEMTGRVCHAIEIAPAYVDVAVKRWQEFTGQQAVLDGDGRTFDSVAAQRGR